MGKVSKNLINTSISEALSKLKEKPQKEGVNLLEITKKLSLRKFRKQ